MEKYVRKLLPKKSTWQITYTGKKLSSQFNIKDKTNFEHRHELIYHANCPIPTCEDNYIGETARCIHERIKTTMEEITGRTCSNTASRNTMAMWLKKAVKLLLRTLKNKKWKRKILESLWMKDLRPTFNTQDKSVPLKLMNWLQKINTCLDLAKGTRSWFLCFLLSLSK